MFQSSHKILDCKVQPQGFSQPWLPWCFDLDIFRLLVADTSHPFGSFFGRCPVIFSLCISPSSAFHPEPYPEDPYSSSWQRWKPLPQVRGPEMDGWWLRDLLGFWFIHSSPELGLFKNHPKEELDNIASCCFDDQLQNPFVSFGPALVMFLFLHPCSADYLSFFQSRFSLHAAKNPLPRGIAAIWDSLKQLLGQISGSLE